MKQSLLGRVMAASCIIMTTAVVPPAGAQNYPNKPVRIIVPAAAAGPTDGVTRMLAEQMSKGMGVPVIVEPKPGGGGNIGADYVAKSAPDGYTLLMGTIGTHAVNRTLYRSLPFDPEKDFEPVSQVVGYPLVVVVKPELPVRNASDLIALAKADPGKLNRASGGSGTGMHLSGEYFNSMAGIKMTHIPYKGSAPAMADLLGGQVDLMFDTVSTVLPHVKTGKVRAIAVTSSMRSPILPDVPPLSDTVPGFNMSSWIGILAPPGTPAPIVARIHQEIARSLATPELREKLLAQSAQPVGSTPAEFREFMKQETARWAKVVRESGAKAD